MAEHLKIMTTRMTEEEADLIKKASEKEGLNIASYIRRNSIVHARNLLEVK